MADDEVLLFRGEGAAAQVSDDVGEGVGAGDEDGCVGAFTDKPTGDGENGVYPNRYVQFDLEPLFQPFGTAKRLLDRLTVRAAGPEEGGAIERHFVIRSASVRRVFPAGFGFDDGYRSVSDDDMVEIETPAAAQAGDIVEDAEAVGLQFFEAIRDHALSIQAQLCFPIVGNQPDLSRKDEKQPGGQGV